MRSGANVPMAIPGRDHMSQLTEPPRGYEAVWPATVIIFGLAVTAAWVMLLGYGVVKLVERTI